MRSEKTQSQIDAEELARRMEKPMRFSCSFCTWEFEGTFGIGKVKAQDHRATEHPEAKMKRRRRGSPAPHLVKRPELSQDESDAVEAERRRRATLHGVDLTDAR